MDLSFSSVNVLIGPNNAGKTKLLQLLHYALCCAHGIGGEVRLPADQSRYEWPKGQILYKPDRTDDVLPGFKDAPVEFTTRCFERSNTARFKFLDIHRGLGSSFDTRDTEQKRRQAEASYSIEDIAAELAANPKLRPVLAYEINKLFGVTMKVEEIGWHLRLWAETGSGPRISFDQQGQGIQDYLALFFYLWHPAYRVILIDEPENNLHPQLQRVFIGRLREIVQEQGKQVFLTSHSPFIALPSKIDDLQGVFLLRPHDPEPKIIALNSIIPRDEEESRRFQSYLPNVDSSVAELFYARGVLIVEGPTERQLIKCLASRTQCDPHELDISIIESNGLSLMAGLIKLAKKVVPHWRALADSDLLVKKGGQFPKWQADIEKGLGLDRLQWEDTPVVRAQLAAAGLDVLPGPGLETLYRSQEAGEYGNLKTVDPADKGWLMECEIARISLLDKATIERDYKVLLTSLQKVRDAVRSSLPTIPSLIDLIRDPLHDEGTKIHRIIYRGRFSERQLEEQQKTDILLRTLLASYTIIEFTSHDNYSLAPLGMKGVKVSCVGKEVRVIDLRPPQRVMSFATVDEP